ncbi:DUF2203 domain-containing protein [Salisediminibacterium halotolerans]|uniref:DUF2203 domain-containing protein n=1 Tax=Salisediminibacterium halotolerans TaxID=517425 RepID=UPI000F29231F|nr:DUF2203 domain-containing protein [Salisediminibacterium halotolerans]RLJ74066.1 hypothetical protein BCL39_1350 [Actinophytocola xinjiangensis]RPE87841.1 hypothetical protein EDD67_1581 [Salisediminibacterium halotolerans]TWG34903.1 hypothetical protein BCL52_1347 [Salisediminibacterium halotolerans]GEL07909.1 hypothetical protein SHA02_13250 [Salisediminibacterium halotolerans]
MDKKTFTLEEANALIPVLETEIAELQRLNQDFQDTVNILNKQKSIDSSKVSTDQPDVFMAESKLEFIEMQARMHVNNVEQYGVEIKDVDVGLVDFPAELNGENVLLCWKYGEKEITHYHGPEDGFAGRKPIQE